MWAGRLRDAEVLISFFFVGKQVSDEVEWLCRKILCLEGLGGGWGYRSLFLITISSRVIFYFLPSQL